jgi:hypothetical protein
MQTPEFNREKFKDALHFVIAHAGGRPGFGAIKLYKTLWFSDAKTWLLTGRSITGEEYIRRQHGPVPKHGQDVISELASEGRIRVWQDRHYDYAQWRFRSLRSPDTNRLNHEEIKTLTYWMRHIAEDHTAESISDESHDYAWEIAKMGEPLPYYSFLASRLRDPTEDELRKARGRTGSLGI